MMNDLAKARWRWTEKRALAPFPLLFRCCFSWRIWRVVLLFVFSVLPVCCFVWIYLKQTTVFLDEFLLRVTCLYQFQDRALATSAIPEGKKSTITVELTIFFWRWRNLATICFSSSLTTLIARRMKWGFESVEWNGKCFCLWSARRKRKKSTKN